MCCSGVWYDCVEVMLFCWVKNFVGENFVVYDGCYEECWIFSNIRIFVDQYCPVDEYSNIRLGKYSKVRETEYSDNVIVRDSKDVNNEHSNVVK